MRLPSLLVAAAIAAASSTASADGLDARVLVIPIQGEAPAGQRGLVADVERALADGAKRLTPNVSRATASLDDTAVIVGCEPTEAACLDAIAAALNVDQLLVAELAAAGDDARIDVTAVTRDAEPVRQQFVIREGSRDADLKALEEAVPAMLEAGEARQADAVAGHATETTPTPTPTPIPATRSSGGGSRIGPLVVTGAGATLMIAGGVFWGLAAGLQGDIDGAPTATAADLQHLSDLEGSARARALAGNALFIGGAAVAAVGVGWYVLGRGHGHPERAVEVTPAPMPGGAAVTIGGVW